jgi:hypothetical protein
MISGTATLTFLCVQSDFNSSGYPSRLMAIIIANITENLGFVGFAMLHMSTARG